jgi:single-stranded-DNA-specific exonuclease
MPDGGAAIPATFLGVGRSLTNRAWRERPADANLVRALAQRHGLSEPLARALVSRGIGEADAGDYLQPTLKALFPDPSSFLDMDRAAEILVDALERGRRAVVFADYDVDGASSSALLVRWFRSLGHELPIYVPDRITEGYGPSPAAFRHLREQGADLVVTVDCGAAAYDAVAAAAEIGLEVVVIDHHLMREDPPRAAAVVNPNRPGCNSGQGNLAAAGVAFVLLAALNREARRRGLFQGRAEPDLRQWLDLAALGAVCDVTRLTGFNRALAAQGLRVMSGWANPGLKALLAAAKMEPAPASVFHAGFILGPRINAGGRIGRADLGARLLATDDPAEAADLAEQLDALNASRKEVESQVLDEAVAAIESAEARPADLPAIVVSGDGWHPGVVGIVAGRLRERYRRPVVVIGVDPVAGIGKGSGRSQPGVNLGRAVQAAFEAGHLMAGGGHAMAAGLTVRADSIAAFRGFLGDRLMEESARAAELDAVEIDGLVTPRAADRALYEDFQRLTPFGPGNPEPLFAVADVVVEQPRLLRGGHVRCTLAGAGGKLKAVAWRAEDTELGRRLLAGAGGLHLAGRLKPDDWNGRRGVEFEVEDAADPRRNT